MSEKAEILLEGSYLYFQNDVNYSQENFKLVQMEGSDYLHIYAEILSRMESGEFLKILVNYEMNQHHVPTFTRIEKSIGNRYAQEVMRFDLANQTLHYSFQTSHGSQEYTKSVNAKHYLTSPAFCTSTIFTLSKKFDATGRTPIVLLGSSNDWTYDAPPEERIVYAEYKNREHVDLQINNSTLSASHLCLYEHDTSFNGGESPVEIFVSKHYGIPYQVVHGNQKIVIKNLKKNT